MSKWINVSHQLGRLRWRKVNWWKSGEHNMMGYQMRGIKWGVYLGEKRADACESIVWVEWKDLSIGSECTIGWDGARQINGSNESCDRDAQEFRCNWYFWRTDVCNSVAENVKASNDWCRTWMANAHKGKGDAPDMWLINRGIELLEHATQIVETTVEGWVRDCKNW